MITLILGLTLTILIALLAVMLFAIQNQGRD